MEFSLGLSIAKIVFPCQNIFKEFFDKGNLFSAIDKHKENSIESNYVSETIIKRQFSPIGH